MPQNPVHAIIMQSVPIATEMMTANGAMVVRLVVHTFPSPSLSSCMKRRTAWTIAPAKGARDGTKTKELSDLD